MSTLISSLPAPASAIPVGHPASPTPLILIGCGAVSRLFYQPAIQEIARRNEARLAALVDPSDSARTSLLEKFPQAQSATDLDGVDAPEGSLAIIASPPRFHAAHTRAALKRGWHVLCEKPMATTPLD